MKKVLYLSLSFLFVMIFFIATNFVSSDFIEPITAPFLEGDTVKTLSLVENHSSLSIFDYLDAYEVNALSFESSLDTQDIIVKWYVHDDVYFENVKGVSEALNARQFMDLDRPIDSFDSEKIHLKLPVNRLNITWGKLEKEDNVVMDIFSSDSGNIDALQHALLNDENIIADIKDHHTGLDMGLFSRVLYESSQIVVLPLLVLSSILALLSYFKNDKRNLSIALLNGHSKKEYLLMKLKQSSPFIIVGFFVIYLLMYFISFKTDLTYLFKVFIPYSLICGTLLFLYGLLSVILIYSFSDVDYLSYMKGSVKKAYTGYFISVLRVIFMAILAFKLIIISISIVGLFEQKTALKGQEAYYKNIYHINSKGLFLETSLAQSDDIVAKLDGFDSFEYFKLAYGLDDKAFIVNRQYLIRENLIDDNAASDKTYVLTKSANMKLMQDRIVHDDSFCKDNNLSCDALEVIELDDELLINPVISGELKTVAEHMRDDFILVADNQTYHILDYHFYIDDNEKKQALQTTLSKLYNEDIELVVLAEQFDKEMQMTNREIKRVSLDALTYLLGAVLLTVLFYRYEFEEKSRELSIKWVYGEAIHRSFVPLMLYQTVISIAVLVVIKLYKFAWLSYLPIILIASFYIITDLLVLKFTLDYFKQNIKKEIKGV